MALSFKAQLKNILASNPDDYSAEIAILEQLKNVVMTEVKNGRNHGTVSMILQPCISEECKNKLMKLSIKKEYLGVCVGFKYVMGSIVGINVSLDDFTD